MALTTLPEGPQDLFGTAQSLRISNYDQWKAEHSAIIIGNRDDAMFNIVASIDPTSELAQKLVPMLKVK